MSQNKQPHTAKLPAPPLLSSCSISEDSAVRLCICVQPVIQELCQSWSSSAQLSPTSSVKTPTEPCSYCKLLRLISADSSAEAESQPSRTVLKIYFSVPTTVTGIEMVLSCQGRSPTTRQVLQHTWFHKTHQGLHSNTASFSEGGFHIPDVNQMSPLQLLPLSTGGKQHFKIM